MNYNANTGNRPAHIRKVKRVSDVNAMGYTPYDPTQGMQSNLYPNLGPESPAPNPYQQNFANQSFNSSQNYGVPPSNPQMYGFNPAPPYPNAQPPPNPQFGGVFGQPIVQDMALQYGQQLANTGKSMIKQEVEKYVPVNSLKYYFAVDTKYVLSKLMLLFFPFTHKDWSVKYEQDGPVQPRFEINAPDLYIPTMAYVTYVLVAGMVLGMQQKFTPEQIGILASSALAWFVVELALYSCTLYIANIKTTLRTLDLLAFSGYKFVGIIISILLSLIGAKTAYYCCLVYVNFALAFFLVRTLKAQVLVESNTQPTSYYGDVVPPTGNKRRLYFLLFVAAVQPVLSWWLSFHLIGSPSPEKTVTE
ncbi:protein YIF1B [Tribolium madens]|uniref:protein YIF1B n=1 Tax=Tribolium madens TaxID=41895 RepID=UPI001CF75129|nr:protein YIF1B [Tribolium madens]